MPTLVRLVIQQDSDPSRFEQMIGRNQPDGQRINYVGQQSITIVTIYRGSWLRQLWKAWRQTHDR